MFTRVLALPMVMAAVMALSGCPTPEIDMRVPGAPLLDTPSHHGLPDR